MVQNHPLILFIKAHLRLVSQDVSHCVHRICILCWSLLVSVTQCDNVECVFLMSHLHYIGQTCGIKAVTHLLLANTFGIIHLHNIFFPPRMYLNCRPQQTIS